MDKRYQESLAFICVLFFCNIPYVYDLYLSNRTSLDVIALYGLLIKQIFTIIGMSGIIFFLLSDFMHNVALERKKIVIISITVLFLMIWQSHFLERSKNKDVLLLLGYCLLLMMVYCNRILKNIVILMSIVMLFVDVYTLSMYQSTFNMGMLNTFIATNYQEAFEYVKRQPIILLACMVMGMAAYFAFRVKRKISDCITIGMKGILIIATSSVVILSVIINMPRYPHEGPLYKDVLFMSFYRIIYIAQTSIITKHQLQDAVNYYDNNPPQLLTDNSDIPYVIFVLGESTSRHHMSVYGYPLDTTPNMRIRAERGEIAAFDNVISPYALTDMVCSTIFLINTDKERRPMNIFDVVREAGYYTKWMSNQEPGGSNSYTGTRIFSSRCDEAEFVNKNYKWLSNETGKYDELLFPMIDKSLEERRNKNFWLIHLMGCHDIYALRYPEKFSFFCDDLETGRDSNEKKIKAEYDNSVLYTDYVVNEIIKRVENKNAVVIYISDHGENVYDVNEAFGHGADNSSYQLDIPLLIWMSDDFRKEHPQKVQQIMNAVNRPYNTRNIQNTILDIMSINVEDFDSRFSVINDKYDHVVNDYRLLPSGDVYKRY